MSASPRLLYSVHAGAEHVSEKLECVLVCTCSRWHLPAAVAESRSSCHTLPEHRRGSAGRPPSARAAAETALSSHESRSDVENEVSVLPGHCRTLLCVAIYLHVKAARCYTTQPFHRGASHSPPDHWQRCPRAAAAAAGQSAAAGGTARAPTPARVPQPAQPAVQTNGTSTAQPTTAHSSDTCRSKCAACAEQLRGALAALMALPQPAAK